MLIPAIRSGMEQPHNGSTLGIIAENMSGLMEIACPARERPVRCRIRAAQGDQRNVFDLERQIERGFGRMAILAPMARGSATSA